jgi:tetratricopeptide (TPR) repeat protein
MPNVLSDLDLALAEHQAGRLDKAEEGYRRFLRSHPNDPNCLHLFGILLSQQEQHDRAIEYLQRAAAAYPISPRVHLNLGMAYRGAARLAEARACFEEAIRLDPSYSDAFNNLGTIFQLEGDLPTAVRHFRQAVKLDPEYRTAQENLAKCLAHMDKPKAALEQYRVVLGLDPNNAEAHFQIGSLYQRLNYLEDARRHYEEAIRLRPRDADAIANLGSILQSEGQLDLAAERFRQAIALRPDTPFAYYFLAEMAKAGRCQVSDDELKQMQAAFQTDRAPKRETSMLAFALANELDRRKRYDEAFEYFRRANELKRGYAGEWGMFFLPDKHKEMGEKIMALFDRPLFERLRPAGVDSEMPVFVVGMPRSGTSLVEQILASHPRVYGAGELMDIPEITDALAGEEGRAARYPACVAETAVDVLRQQAEGYLRILSELEPSADRVVDKLPGNFMHLGLISILFPKASIIHCKRDPRDTCLSCFQQNFRHLVFTTSLEALGLYYREYERMMEHWRRVLPIQMYEIQYEELVDELEGKSREMIAYCGLDWDQRCLAFHENKRTVHTASELQVRRPVYKTSVARWKRYEKHLGPLFQALAEPTTGT